MTSQMKEQVGFLYMLFQSLISIVTGALSLLLGNLLWKVLVFVIVILGFYSQSKIFDGSHSAFTFERYRCFSSVFLCMLAIGSGNVELIGGKAAHTVLQFLCAWYALSLAFLEIKGSRILEAEFRVKK
eukprot:CAMPEP_0197519712 /NCGR_PEP_ID=MMETSP1318-20131121/4978_1 /TAXON_ID=552666 /ORGANISM="Partenskyella glossopodia, Strain RCC365" /LENGTH=127 /DNA_ID=CAMNT_0043070859 /DNA_START=917 /DNA_END=1300 /DNA_ORIENTATION=+